MPKIRADSPTKEFACMKLARQSVAPLISAAFLSALTALDVATAVAQATPSDNGQPATVDAKEPAPPADAASPPDGQPATTTTPEASEPLDPAPGVPTPAAQTSPPAATPDAPAQSPPPEQMAAPPAQSPPAATTPPAAETAPATQPAATPPATTPPPAAPEQAQAAPAPPPADPVVAAVRDVLADTSATGKSAPQDREAASAYYQARTEGPLWVKPDGALTPAGEAVVAEIRKADDWGLNAASYTLPQPGTDTAPQALAKSEATLALAVLQYAREARGGRVNPQALSPALDLTPTLKDPKLVLDEIAKSSGPDAYLRDLHPKHEQFVRLREALLKLREPAAAATPEDEALSVKIPPGKVIKPGMQHADVSLLRRRLKVPAEAGNENIYDEPLQEAVMAFQRASAVTANGFVGKATRAALNGEETGKPDPARDVQRIVNNMERWRWMPLDLGAFHIWNNIPEFKTRAIKDNKQVYEERIVVGLPQWATPSFSAQMKTIVFHPEWGVPDGIKQKELGPQLRRSSGGGMGIFEDLFGGGGGGSSSAVLRRHDLRVSHNGRSVNPDSVDWNSVDIRRFQFTQPSGPKNVLGIVKFMFPNKHDVYMHDTTAKHLFKQNMRAYSHGCMRVQNPVKFAELLLAEDKGWSPEQVEDRFRMGGLNEVKIDRPIWVHSTYFTAVVDDGGKLQTFADVYGFEPRVAAALTGKQFRFEAPPQIAEVDPDAPRATTQRRKKQRVTQTDPLTEAISGLFAN
jgi:murein L,D-transpeptidase YcbB/YkuD